MEQRRPDTERDGNALAETGDALLHPAAYTNGGYVMDLALVDGGRACDNACSACGHATGRVSIEAERICSVGIVQATRFCSRECAVRFCSRALDINNMSHMWPAVAARINGIFADAEHDSSNVRHMYAAPADDREITPLGQLFPDLASSTAVSTSSDDTCGRASLATTSMDCIATPPPPLPSPVALPMKTPLTRPAHWASLRPPSPLRYGLTAAQLAATMPSTSNAMDV